MSKIRDKRTGKIIEVPREQLSRYGVSKPVPTRTQIPQQQKSGLKEKAGMIGSLLGGIFGGPIGTFGGSIAGKRIEQGRSPIPTSPMIDLATKKLDPELYQQLQEKEDPEQDIKDLGYAGGQTVADIIGGFLGKKILKPVADKVLGPLRKINISTPKGVQKSIEVAQKTVNDKIDDLISKSTTKGNKIKTAPILEELAKLADEYGPKGKNISKAVDKIGKTFDEISSLGSEITPEQANMVRKGFGEQVYGEAGKELSKRGTGIAEKKAMKIAGGGIREQLTEQIDALDKLLKEYGKLSGTKSSLNQPFKGGFTTAGLAGIASLLGAPQLGAPLALGAVSKMPYTNFLGKKAAGGTLDVLAASSPILAKLLFDSMQGQQEDNVQLPNENIQLR